MFFSNEKYTLKAREMQIQSPEKSFFLTDFLHGISRMGERELKRRKLRIWKLAARRIAGIISSLPSLCHPRQVHVRPGWSV